AGVRLNTRKATLRAWRDQFAANLRELGVAANATERARPQRSAYPRTYGYLSSRATKRLILHPKAMTSLRSARARISVTPLLQSHFVSTCARSQTVVRPFRKRSFRLTSSVSERKPRFVGR